MVKQKNSTNQNEKQIVGIGRHSDGQTGVGCTQLIDRKDLVLIAITQLTNNNKTI